MNSNESLHEISNDNGVRVVNFAISKSTMYPHHNIHKLTWTPHDWKMQNQIDYILIHKRQYSDAGVRSFKGADCNTIIWWL
jgi:hypothetical protein